MSKAKISLDLQKANSQKKETSINAPLKRVSISKASLIALTNASSRVATISAIFKNGLGQITASLFRNGMEINTQTISQSGDIVLSDVQSRDAVAINGVCSGSASISIDVPASPDSPQTFNSEIIFTRFLIN